MATITIHGRAAVPTKPDEAVIFLECEAVRTTAAEALADVSGRIETLLALCDELEVPAASRTTAGVSVAEHGEHDREGHWQHRGYRAANRVRLRLVEPDGLGRLLAEAVARAGARVDGPWWEIAPANAARLEACRLAATDARSRAQAYAEALGLRVGAVVAVRDPPPDGRPEPRGAMRSLASAHAADVPVEAGEQLVAAEVEVEFGLEQG